MHVVRSGMESYGAGSGADSLAESLRCNSLVVSVLDSESDGHGSIPDLWIF